MKCKFNCKHGHISTSGKVLTCFSPDCPVQLGSTGMVLLEDISISRLEDCKAYKKHVPVSNENSSFTTGLF